MSPTSPFPRRSPDSALGSLDPLGSHLAGLDPPTQRVERDAEDRRGFLQAERCWRVLAACCRLGVGGCCCILHGTVQRTPLDGAGASAGGGRSGQCHGHPRGVGGPPCRRPRYPAVMRTLAALAAGVILGVVLTLAVAELTGGWYTYRLLADYECREPR